MLQHYIMHLNDTHTHKQVYIGHSHIFVLGVHSVYSFSYTMQPLKFKDPNRNGACYLETKLQSAVPVALNCSLSRYQQVSIS
jgi:hypothetical protein